MTTQRVQRSALLVLGLLLGLLTARTHAQPPPTKPDPDGPIIQCLVSQALKVPFKLRVLGLGRIHDGGLPQGPGRLCILLEPPQRSIVAIGFYGHVKVRMLHRLSELRGQVQITTPDAALAFVRLATSPTTCYTLARREEAGYEELEVFCKGQDVRPLSYGLRWPPCGVPLNEWRSFPEGCYGLISAGMAKQLGIEFAKVSVSGTGFGVERTLVVRGANYLVKTQEWVGPDGEYRINKNEKIVLPSKPRLEWRFPLFSNM